MPSASSKKDLSQWLAPSYFCFSCREPQEYALSNQHPSIAYGRVLHPMCDQSLSAHWGLILMGRAHSRQCYGIFWGFVWTIIQYNFSFSLILIHHHLYLQVLISNYLAQKASHYLVFFHNPICDKHYQQTCPNWYFLYVTVNTHRTHIFKKCTWNMPLDIF